MSHMGRLTGHRDLCNTSIGGTLMHPTRHKLTHLSIYWELILRTVITTYPASEESNVARFRSIVKFNLD